MLDQDQEDSEIAQFVLNMQVDAVTRCFIISTVKPTSVREAVEKLAESEEKAKYICGFIGLAGADREIGILERYMKKNGFIETDSSGKTVLTKSGEARGELKPLPDQIEDAFKVKVRRSFGF